MLVIFLLLNKCVKASLHKLLLLMGTSTWDASLDILLQKLAVDYRFTNQFSIGLLFNKQATLSRLLGIGAGADILGPT